MLYKVRSLIGFKDGNLALNIPRGGVVVVTEREWAQMQASQPEGWEVLERSVPKPSGPTSDLPPSPSLKGGVVQKVGK